MQMKLPLKLLYFSTHHLSSQVVFRDWSTHQHIHAIITGNRKQLDASAPTNTSTSKALQSFISSAGSTLPFLHKMIPRILPIRPHLQKTCGGEWELDPPTESPKGFISTFYKTRAPSVTEHVPSVSGNENLLWRVCISLNIAHHWN